MGDGDDRDRDVRPAIFGDRSARERPAPWARREGPDVRPWVPGGRRVPEEEPPPEPAEAPSDEAGTEGPSQPADEELDGQDARPAVDEAPPEDEEASAPPVGPCQQCETVRADAAAERDALLEALQDPYLRAAADLRRAADELSEGFYDAVIDLTARLASAVLQRAVAVDPDVMRANLQRALEIAGSVTAVTLRCHPDDAAAMREVAPELARESAGRPVDVTVRPSSDVERGSCIVLFDEGIVDARWSQQLDRLADAVRTVVQTPGGPAPGAPEEEEPG